MPKRAKLPRGRFLRRWRVYFREANGIERWKWAEKIIDRTVAEAMAFTLDYDGPMTPTRRKTVAGCSLRFQAGTAWRSAFSLSLAFDPKTPSRCEGTTCGKTSW
jgi:hypothetical protein